MNSNILIHSLSLSTLQLLNMSPHAPTSVSNLQQPPTPIDHLLDKNTPAPTPTDQHDSKSITASPYVHQTPSVEPPSYATEHGASATATAPGSVPSQQQPATPTPATAGGAGTAGGAATPAGGAGAAAGAATPTQCGTISVKKLEMQPASATVSSTLVQVKQEPGTVVGVLSNKVTPQQPVATSAMEAVTNLFNLYKPPQLTLKDSDSFYDEEWLKDVIYDFSFQENW